jgi:O-antigen/teichoic acid export membrane protein
MRAFFTSLSWLLALNLLIKPLWILMIDRKVQTVVGNEAYGNYFALLSLSIILSFIADAGLTNYVNQRIASGNRIALPLLLKWKSAFLGLYILVCLIAALIVGIDTWNIYLFVVLIQALTSLLVFFRGLITANQLFKTDVWISILDKGLLIVICMPLLYTGFVKEFDLSLFLQIQFLTLLASNLLCLVIMLRVSSHQQKKESITTPSLLLKVLPFAIIILVMSVHYRLDGFLLQQLISSREAGLYAAGYRLVEAVNIPGYLLASFLTPFIASRSPDHEINQVIAAARHILLIPALLLAGFAAFYSGWIQELLYHSNDPVLSELIALCLFSVPGYYLVHVYGSLLTGKGKLRQFIFILIGSVLLNVLLNLWLIPSLGARGSGVAAIFSQLACGTALLMYSIKTFNLSFSLADLLIYCCALATGLALAYSSMLSDPWLFILSILFTVALLLLLVRYLKRLISPHNYA